MKLDVRPPSPLELESFFVVADRPNRQVLVERPGVKVMHLTLAPGQVLPPHRHPGCYVLVQGLRGTATVRLEGEAPLPPQHLLGFSGEVQVSLRNDSDAPSALLITLIRGDERRPDEDASLT